MGPILNPSTLIFTDSIQLPPNYICTAECGDLLSMDADGV